MYFARPPARLPSVIVILMSSESGVRVMVSLLRRQEVRNEFGVKAEG